MRGDVPRDAVSRSRLSKVGCIIQSGRSCIPELKNGGNGRHRHARETARGRNVPLHSLARITYLTSLGYERGRRAVAFIKSLPTSAPSHCRWISPVAFRPSYPCTLFFPRTPFNSPAPRSFSPGFSTSTSTFSRLRARRESGLAQPAGAADLLRVCKFELKELSTSANPRKIYRRVCFHEYNVSSALCAVID